MLWSEVHLEVRPLNLELACLYAEVSHVWALAALFFCTYDTLKQHSPLSPQFAPLTHMLSASIGEVVRLVPFLAGMDDLLTGLVRLSTMIFYLHTKLGCVLSSRPHGSHQNSYANRELW